MSLTSESVSWPLIHGQFSCIIDSVCHVVAGDLLLPVIESSCIVGSVSCIVAGDLPVVDSSCVTDLESALSTVTSRWSVSVISSISKARPCGHLSVVIPVCGSTCLQDSAGDWCQC